MSSFENLKIMQDKKKIIKYAVLDYIQTYMKYYVKKEDLEKEKQKLFKALKDLFANVPLEEMSDNKRFCENGRFNFLMRKNRENWGKKFLLDINKIIIDRL
ncbi:MAG: hypothetical protein FWC41_08885 [Firmicutes bacterium]|nr:hypothetical protein [Bacillota bacterium]